MYEKSDTIILQFLALSHFNKNKTHAESNQYLSSYIWRNKITFIAYIYTMCFNISSHSFWDFILMHHLYICTYSFLKTMMIKINFFLKIMHFNIFIHISHQDIYGYITLINNNNDAKGTSYWRTQCIKMHRYILVTIFVSYLLHILWKYKFNELLLLLFLLFFIYMSIETYECLSTKSSVFYELPLCMYVSYAYWSLLITSSYTNILWIWEEMKIIIIVVHIFEVY